MPSDPQSYCVSTEVCFQIYSIMKANVLKGYYNPRLPGSFGGLERLKRQYPKLPRRELQRILQSTSTYSQHKRVVHKFRRRKVNVHTSNYLWQADLLCLPKLKYQNSHYQYILTAIDVFNKKAFAEPVKRKTGKEVTAAFNVILKRAMKCPVLLQVDNGTEFYSADFKRNLKAHGIKMFSSFSELKACVVERFNQSLMMRLQKWFHFTKKKRYIDVLQDVMKAYNNSYHSTIKCTPNSVNKHNEMDIWLETNKDLWKRKNRNHANLKAGDYVRLKIPKTTFEKGYAAKFTPEVYKISQVLQTSPVTYQVCNSDGETVKGIFYYEELSKVV